MLRASLLRASAWRSANVPYRKSENARTFPSRSQCGWGHERKRFQKLCGIDYVPAIIQLARWEPPTFDCSVDCRSGDACGRCCAAWCVHIATRALYKAFLSCSYALVKDQLTHAAEQRRSGADLNHFEVGRQPPPTLSGSCPLKCPFGHASFVEKLARHAQATA
jgi:hypothetical protein